jgi:hypothetical protein
MRFFGKLGAEPVVRAAWVEDSTVFYCTAAQVLPNRGPW